MAGDNKNSKKSTTTASTNNKSKSKTKSSGSSGGVGAKSKASSGANASSSRGFVLRPAGAKSAQECRVDNGSFVKATIPLLELEHEAELAEAGAMTSQLSNESQQKRGIALNHLKCEDVQVRMHNQKRM